MPWCTSRLTGHRKGIVAGVSMKSPHRGFSISFSRPHQAKTECNLVDTLRLIVLLTPANQKGDTKLSRLVCLLCRCRGVKGRGFLFRILVVIASVNTGWVECRLLLS